MAGLLGVPEFERALAGMVAAADRASREAVAKGAHLIEAETKRNLALTSHRKGTPTPSPPGQPPSLVTGQLRRSIQVKGPVSLGSGTWQASVGPTAVYGRIQELGGVTGRGGRSYLPPRPYLGPALDSLVSSGRLAKLFAAAWGAAGYRG